MDKCLYQFGLDDDNEIPDLLTPSTRYILFEIQHGEPSSQYEEHEIISIHFVPEDCDQNELIEAVEDYYQLYFTGETWMCQQALQRLIK